MLVFKTLSGMMNGRGSITTSQKLQRLEFKEGRLFCHNNGVTDAITLPMPTGSMTSYGLEELKIGDLFIERSCQIQSPRDRQPINGRYSERWRVCTCGYPCATSQSTRARSANARSAKSECKSLRSLALPRAVQTREFKRRISS